MVDNWLITGGCGFIGSTLIQKLLFINKDINIRVLDNLLVGSKGDLGDVCKFSEITEVHGSPKGVELFVGDIRSEEDVKAACTGINTIVHLAANTGVGPSVKDPKLDMDVNIRGTFNVLDAARNQKVNKFIFASSGAPIGELENPPIHEELPAHPVSPYGASKLAGEGYCSAYYRTYGLKTIALRFGNVYGPRSKHKASVVAKFIKLAMDKKICNIYGTGEQTRDFIYINDIIEAIIASSKVELGGEIFQIATATETTVLEVAEIIKMQLSNLDISMNIVHESARLGDVARNYSDTSKAENILNWKAKMSLSDGIHMTIDYFISS